MKTLVIKFLCTCWIVHIATSTTRLANYHDFQHGGHFLSNVYSFIDENPDSSTLKQSELDVIDHETWWLEEEKRSLVIPTLVYKGDTSRLLELMSNHNNWDRSNVSHIVNSDKMNHGESLVENIMLNFPVNERNNKLFLCRPHTLLPYRFTVLGDSHTGVFDVAALKVNNMNVTTIVSATMYGIKNFNSKTQAAGVFRNVIMERRQLENIDRNVLVFNLGDCDVQGLSWRKYLVNETEGIERSLASFSDFLICRDNRRIW